MEIKGLMEHRDYPYMSRDWEDLDCKASCVYQRCNKCTIPSRAKINDEGRCEGFRRENQYTGEDLFNG